MESLLGISMNVIWFLVGVGFIFLEFIIPGLVIAFFGVGAIITALIISVVTVSIVGQVIIFSVSSVLSIIFLRKYFTKIFAGKETGAENYGDFNVDVGMMVPVVELIEPSVIGGKVKYQGTIWEAKADTVLSPGESVEIVGRENLTLIVKKK
jgi:membrane protein implicated in regulation of membrane protease activity